MTDARQNYTTTGLVATTPRHLKTADGIDITSFRLASASKRFDPKKMEWIEADTNWFTITSFGTLAINAVSSIGKGDRIIVSGTLRVRDWDNGERSGTSVEIEADTLGHDLVWGQSTFVRTTLTEPKPVIRPTSVPKEEPAIV
jgi:single-strand DNA-binding protein